MSPKLKCHQKWNITKNKKSPKLKSHQNWTITQNKLSLKLKYQKNWTVTNTKISQKLKCHQKQNVTKTEMLPHLKMSSKSTSKSKAKSRRSAQITLVLFCGIIYISQEVKRSPICGIENPLLDTRISVLCPPSFFVTLRRPPPWILKRAGLESSDQGLISSIGKAKIIAFFLSLFSAK